MEAYSEQVLEGQATRMSAHSVRSRALAMSWSDTRSSTTLNEPARGCAISLPDDSPKAGTVAGPWPGLADQDLELGEDLRIETDLRSVFSELLLKRLGRTDVSQVFPDFSGPTDLSLFLS
jgi:hypothetical protein